MVELQSYNPLNYMQSQKEIDDYLTEAYQDSDPMVFVVALGHVVKKIGFATVAKDCGLNRESLYKTFSEKVQPKWDTLHKVMHAVSVKTEIKISA